MTTKSVRTKRLDVAYLESGPSDGHPVLLLHGFPDDATCWIDVMDKLAAEGRRAIAPFVRGCGDTKFLDDKTPRAGDFAAIGQDAVDLVDALDLRDLTVVGQDWGSPTAEIVAVERSDHVRRLVKLNWYGVYSMAEMAKAQSFNYPQLAALWYVWMLNTPMGEMVLQNDRAGFAKELWAEWSPSWDKAAREKALDSVTKSFESEDWSRVVLSAYRANITETESDPADDELRKKLQNPPPIERPTTIINGQDDGVELSPLDEAALSKYFPAGVTVEALEGIGHFPQREAPDAVAKAILTSE